MDWTSILPGSTGTFGPWAQGQFGSLSGPPQAPSAQAQPQPVGPPLQLNPPGVPPNLPQQQPQGGVPVQGGGLLGRMLALPGGGGGGPPLQQQPAIPPGAGVAPIQPPAPQQPPQIGKPPGAGPFDVGRLRQIIGQWGSHPNFGYSPYVSPMPWDPNEPRGMAVPA